MKIAILTFHRAYNCGAVLQAWALKTVLERMGHDVSFPACNHVGDLMDFLVLDVPLGKRGFSWLHSVAGRLVLDCKYTLAQLPVSMKFRRFRKRYIRENSCSSYDVGKLYDLVICGSDQVWNPGITKRFARLFLGSCLGTNIPKIAYAASCGDKMLDNEGESKLRDGIPNFSTISVRETLTKYQVLKVSGLDPKIVADPTLLLKAADYLSLASEKTHKRRYLYFYTLYATDYEMGLAEKLANRLGVDLIVSHGYYKSDRKKKPYIVKWTGPEEFLNYMASAEYVLAASFHGTALSLIFEKQFLSIRNQVDAVESRPETLLKSIGLSERLVNPSIPFDEMYRRLTASVPKEAYKRLACFAEDSIEWLRGAINTVCAQN